jgi:hypothetical protein
MARLRKKPVIHANHSENETLKDQAAEKRQFAAVVPMSALTHETWPNLALRLSGPNRQAGIFVNRLTMHLRPTPS